MSDTGEENFAADFDDFPEDEVAGDGTIDENVAEEEEGVSEDEEELASDVELDEVEPDQAGDSLPREEVAECQVHVIRDKSMYMLSPMMTLLEVARVLAVRSEQIARNNNPFLPDHIEACSPDPVQVALQELILGMNPLIIRRSRTHGDEGVTVVEDWKVRELIVPTDVLALVL